MQEIYASVTERGQVTIPAEVRRQLGLRTRDKIIFVIDDDRVLLKRPKYRLEDVYGSIPALAEPKDWDEVLRIAHDEAARSVVNKTKEQ